MNKIRAGIAGSLSMLSLAAMTVVHAQATPPAKASEEAPNRLEAAPAPQLRTDSNVFQTLGPGSQIFREEIERLRDPEQRAVMRAQQREQILESHQDIGKLLQLDAATQSKLIELLTDQKMADQELFYTSAMARSSPHNPADIMRTRAQRETAKVQALRELLGQDKLERYQAFATRVNDYRQVARFDARLAAAHKLDPEQRDRLVELYYEQSRSEADRIRFSMRSQMPFPGLVLRGRPSQDELQRQSFDNTLTANEENWRRMSKVDAQFRQQAAQFLTPPQLGMLAQIQAEKASQLQHWVESAREQAGLSRNIPEQPEAPERQLPAPVDGQIKLAVKLWINDGEAIHFTHTARNGESVTFRGAEGLYVEVRPTVFVDDGFDVRVFYHEEISGGRRRLIGESGQMGVLLRTASSAANGTGQGLSSSVITGNQGYAIELSTQLEPM